MSSDPQHVPTPELFFDTVFAHQKTAALKAAIELELFTAIAGGARTAAAIAQRVKAPERGIRILCDYMTVLGFLTKAGDTYTLTQDTAFSSRRIAGVLGGTIGFLATPELTKNFERLTERFAAAQSPPRAIPCPTRTRSGSSSRARWCR